MKIQLGVPRPMVVSWSLANMPTHGDSMKLVQRIAARRYRSMKSAIGALLAALGSSAAGAAIVTSLETQNYVSVSNSYSFFGPTFNATDQFDRSIYSFQESATLAIADSRDVPSDLPATAVSSSMNANLANQLASLGRIDFDYAGTASYTTMCLGTPSECSSNTPSGYSYANAYGAGGQYVRFSILEATPFELAYTFSGSGAFSDPQHGYLTNAFYLALYRTSGALVFNLNTQSTGSDVIFGVLDPGEYFVNSALYSYGNGSVGLGGAVTGQANGYLVFPAVTAVPLPASAWLLFSGLGGLMALSRRYAAVRT